MDDIEAGGGGGSSSQRTIPLSLLSSSSPASLPRLRILVLGDHGCGKTALCQRIAGRSVQEVSAGMEMTTGCATECKLYQTRSAIGGSSLQMLNGGGGGQLHGSGGLQHRSGSMMHAPSSSGSSSSPLVWFEFWDVSGHRKFELSRSVFYRDLDGLLLVFDLMNRKSYENIRRWIKEIVRIHRERPVLQQEGNDNGSKGGAGGNGNNAASPAPLRPTSAQQQTPHQSPSLKGLSNGPLSSLSSALGHLPVLLIGNKNDVYRGKQKEQGAYESVKDFGIDCVYLVRLSLLATAAAPLFSSHLSWSAVDDLAHALCCVASLSVR